MTTYSKQPLNKYLDSVATEKNISKQELQKRVFIDDFSVQRSPSLLFNFFKAEKDFREMAGKYDSVVNVKRRFNPGFLGLTCRYEISGTGINLNKSL
ncbi:MAG: hypothetical protein Q8O84_05165 [Nanoarchaeota archaeon]|nr:hypothetical protein [Nanoarchaeota archaeon]